MKLTQSYFSRSKAKANKCPKLPEMFNSTLIGKAETTIAKNKSNHQQQSFISSFYMKQSLTNVISLLTLVSLRTVEKTGWLSPDIDRNTPSLYTEERGKSRPDEPSKPRSTGINIGSLIGCPGVGGTSCLWNSNYLI